MIGEPHLRDRIAPDIKNKLLAITKRLDSIEAGRALNLNTSSQGLGENITSLKLQLKLLESRIPVHNILHLGGLIFQSRADLGLFVETKMPSNAFSMFHDIMTLMERLSGAYVERNRM
jgi:hypothetical protein